MIAIKICGITRREDAELAAALGAWAVGFVLWPQSPRATSLDTVRDIVTSLTAEVTPVGVFVDPTADDINAAADAGIRVAQVHGDDTRSFTEARIPVIRAVHLAADRDGVEPDIRDELILLDAHDPAKHGGTGKTVDWLRARLVAETRRIILAGGLTPANVRQAIEAVHPYAVDVASGVESSPGIKNHDLVRSFIEAARSSGTKGTHGTSSTSK